MNKIEIKIKQIELLINDFTTLRNIYMSIVVVLTGGNIGLFYHLSIFNIILLIFGIYFDCRYFIKAKIASKRIKILIRKLGEIEC